MKSKNCNSFSSLSLKYTQLQKVQTIVNTGMKDFKLGRKNGIKSIDVYDKEVKVMVYDDINLQSDEQISIQLEALACFHYEDFNIRKFIEDKDKGLFDSLTYPAFSLTSLVIGFLTDKINNQPHIVLPLLIENTKEEKDGIH